MTLQAEAAALTRAATFDGPVPVFATIPDWSAISGISRSRTYELLASGALRAKRVGNRTIVDVRHGLAWLASQPDVELGKKTAA